MQISRSTLPKKTRDRTQFAALPFRIGTSGRPEIMLLTSRETGRWVIPKGWPIKGLKPREVASREAYEQAVWSAASRANAQSASITTRNSSLKAGCSARCESFCFRWISNWMTGLRGTSGRPGGLTQLKRPGRRRRAGRDRTIGFRSAAIETDAHDSAHDYSVRSRSDLLR